jgi:MFS family permease
MLCFFVAGIGLNGFETVSLVYITEVSSEKFRNWAGVILTVCWSLAQIIFSGVTSLTMNWRVICIALIGIPFLLGVFFTRGAVLESPRWLASKKRFAETKQVLSQIALANG